MNYIEQKYGFTPEVISSKRYIDSGLYEDIFLSYYSKKTDDYKVVMKHADRQFTVYIPFKNKSVDGRDDYQIEEIVEATKNRIDTFFDGKTKKILLSDNHSGWSLSEHEYFDGTNLDTFLREDQLYNVYTVGADLSSKDLHVLLDELGGKSINVYDSKTDEAFEALWSQDNFVNGQGNANSILVKEEYPLLDEAASIYKNSEPEYVKIQLESFGDFLYDASSVRDLSVQETDDKDLSDPNKRYISMSPCYSLETNTGFYLYYPQCLIPEDAKDIKIIYSCTMDNGKKHYGSLYSLSWHDNPYCYFKLEEKYLKDLKIMLVEEKH